MYTVIETPIFSKMALDILCHDELQEFCTYIAHNPEVGDVIIGSGGCRKIRWSKQKTGKRGGVRIIYYNQLTKGIIYLLIVYAKSINENIPAHLLKKIKEEIEKND